MAMGETGFPPSTCPAQKEFMLLVHSGDPFLLLLLLLLRLKGDPPGLLWSAGLGVAVLDSRLSWGLATYLVFCSDGEGVWLLGSAEGQSLSLVVMVLRIKRYTSLCHICFLLLASRSYPTKIPGFPLSLLPGSPCHHREAHCKA